MIRKLKRIYIKFWDLIQRIVLVKQHRKEVSGYTHKQVLTSQQKKAAKEFFKPYTKISLIYHNFFTEKTQEFYPEYIPDDVWYNDIDCYFNHVKDAKVLDNKCFYARMFPGVKQPETVLYRMNGFWYKGNMEMISFEQALECISNEQAVFVKQASESYGGHGVEYIDNSLKPIATAFSEMITLYVGDLVVQRPIKQHADIAKLNESSVNTIRILSLLREDGVKIYSSVIRMGVAGSKVDNACSGGVNCGINPDGTLKKYAYSWSGNRVEKHPTSNIVFENYKLPYYEKAVDLIKNIHKMVPHFRLVSWDVSIDETGEPLLLEANLNRGGLLLHQHNNGPVFGEDTKLILDEVFKK